LKKPDIWVNGEFVPWDKASIHPLGFSMQRGATLFESIDCNPASNGRAAVFRLEEHMRRFINSASIIKMPLPYSLTELMKAVTDTVARSGMKHLVIRPIAFYSEPVMQVHPGENKVIVVIGLTEAHPPLPSFKVMISEIRKIDSVSMPVRAKVSANYIGPMLAKSEAIASGYDDAILLDRSGNVAEGSTSNIYIVENGKLFTAPLDTVLAGITRDTINKLAAILGIDVVEEKFTPDRMKAADEAIICSSHYHIGAIESLDGTKIGETAPGPITSKLNTFFKKALIGEIPEMEHWLTYV
jgi:branched-chain amino acid aminotransferase